MAQREEWVIPRSELPDGMYTSTNWPLVVAAGLGLTIAGLLTAIVLISRKR